MIPNYYKIYKGYRDLNHRPDVLEYARILSQGYSSRSSQELIEAFRKNGMDISQLPKEVFMLLFSFSEKGHEKFVAELQQLDDTLLHAPEWFGLSSTLIGVKKLSAALVLREKGLDRIDYYQKRMDSVLFVDLIIGKCIERLEFDNLSKYLRIARVLRTAAGKSGFNKKLQEYIKGDISPVLSTNDQAYKQYMANKSVAIVGPLELGELERNEISGFDAVITVNDLYFGRELRANAIESDVVYFTGRMQNYIHEITEIAEGRKIPKYIIGKFEMEYPEYLTSRIKFRTMDQYNFFVVNGGFNLVPRVIVDVIMQKPKLVKVFGADLYASKAYNKNYEGKSDLNSWETIYTTFTNHDIITQYKFMYNMYKYKFIQADERLKKVLELGIYDFLKLFEHRKV